MEVAAPLVFTPMRTESVLASAVVAHVSGLSAPATTLAVVAHFQMLCGTAIGHGLSDPQRQGVPHSSHTRALCSWCSVLGRQMGPSLRAIAK